MKAVEEGVGLELRLRKAGGELQRSTLAHDVRFCAIANDFSNEHGRRDAVWIPFRVAGTGTQPTVDFRICILQTGRSLVQANGRLCGDHLAKAGTRHWPQAVKALKLQGTAFSSI
jgi:hypothetical protein